MQLQIQDVGVLELWDAMADGAIEKVEFLLAAGVDPNARYYELECKPSEPPNDSPNGDERIFPPIYFWDNTGALPLRIAGENPASSMGTYTHTEKKAMTARLMDALLQHGANPYALSRQHFHLYRDFSAFPGQPRDAQFEDEESDLYGGMFARWALNNIALEDARLSSQLIYPSISWEYDGWDEGADYEYKLPHPYRLRSIFHCLLEGGKLVQPIIDSLGDKIEVDRRDTDGRTLFLASCRHPLGLDAAVSSMAPGPSYNSIHGGIAENPYPQPDNPWR